MFFVAWPCQKKPILYHIKYHLPLREEPGSIKDEIWHYGRLDDYIKYHNTDRLHLVPNIDNYETLMIAFRNRKAINKTSMQNPKWVEADINE